LNGREDIHASSIGKRPSFDLPTILGKLTTMRLNGSFIYGGKGEGPPTAAEKGEKKKKKAIQLEKSKRDPQHEGGVKRERADERRTERKRSIFEKES